jgi:hypothetical protein
MATTLNSHEACSAPLRREVIARRSEADPPAEEELAGVMEVLAKAPVLLRADASAEQRQRDKRRMIGRAKYETCYFTMTPLIVETSVFRRASHATILGSLQNRYRRCAGKGAGGDVAELRRCTAGAVRSALSLMTGNTELQRNWG